MVNLQSYNWTFKHYWTCHSYSILSSQKTFLPPSTLLLLTIWSKPIGSRSVACGPFESVSPMALIPNYETMTNVTPPKSNWLFTSALSIILLHSPISPPPSQEESLIFQTKVIQIWMTYVVIQCLWTLIIKKPDPVPWVKKLCGLCHPILDGPYPSHAILYAPKNCSRHSSLKPTPSVDPSLSLTVLDLLLLTQKMKMIISILQ